MPDEVTATAAAPEPLVRDTLDCGLLLRRHARAVLDTLGVVWVEHKGLLDSTFVITANRKQWAQIRRWVQRVNVDA